MTRRALILLPALLAACDDVSGPTLRLPVGTMQVSYDAQQAGGAHTMSASGELSLVDGEIEAPGFAAAGRNAKLPNKLTVVGFDPRAEDGSMNGRVFAITIPATGGPRTIDIIDGCTTADCSATLFFNGVDADDPHREVNPDVDRACAITDGTVVILEQSATRVRGTFSGTGYCVFDNRTDPFTPFTVSAGSFDVPVDLRYRPPFDLY